MEPIQYLGLLAGGIAVFSALPQILKIIKTRKTRDISLHTYILLLTATILWIVYGLISNQIAVVVSNAIFIMFCLMFCLIILFLKIKHG